MSYFTISADCEVAWINGSQDTPLVTKLEDLDFDNGRTRALVKGIAFVNVGDPMLCMLEFPISGGSIQGTSVRALMLPIVNSLVRGMTPETAAQYVAHGSWIGSEGLAEFHEARMTEKDLSIVVKFFAKMVLSAHSLNLQGLTEVSKRIDEED